MMLGFWVGHGTRSSRKILFLTETRPANFIVQRTQIEALIQRKEASSRSAIIF